MPLIHVFNIIVVTLVLLIGYWWANQGLFSAILHLLCVIVAGAITLAFWELLTVRVLLRGNTFDNFAWGVTFVGLFVVSLFVLRLATNKLIPANVNLPHWANLTFGFPVGLAAGVLSMGMVMIGIGFVQSHREVLGYIGYARSVQTGRVERLKGNTIWLPVHRWTDEFYSWLSVTSLRTRQPLRHYNPALYKQAGSLMRDSYDSGIGQLSLKPSEASIDEAYLCRELNRCAIQVHFDAGAIDFGEQLTLTASQLRLISRVRPGSTARPSVSYPVRWKQDVSGGGTRIDDFDGYWKVITSVPGRETADILIEFDFPGNLDPAFVQIKGTRFGLSDVQVVSPAHYEGVFEGGSVGRSNPPPAANASTGSISSDDIKLTNRIRIRISTNMLRGSIKHIDRFLSEGESLLQEPHRRPSRKLMVLGIHEPKGTRIIQLDVSRGTSADIFGSVRERVDNGAKLALVDSDGNTYSPIGFLHTRGDGLLVKLKPSKRIETIGELPSLPVVSKQKLKLVFRVTEGVTIARFQVGGVIVGRCDLEATPAK